MMAVNRERSDRLPPRPDGTGHPPPKWIEPGHPHARSCSVAERARGRAV